MHRFLWDVHLQPLGAGAAAGGGLGAVPTQLPIQAIPYNSPTAATTPWAAPGTYTIELTVEGKSYSQPIVVRQDPRVKTPALEMQKVYALTSALYFGAADAQAAASTLGAHAGPAHRDVVSGTGCDGAGDRRVREEGGSAGRDTTSRWRRPRRAWRPRSARAGSAAGRGNGPRCRRDHRRHVVGDGCRARPA